MMMVTDLGDFKTVMSGGSKLATMGFGEGDKNLSVKAVIKHSLSHAGLLYELDPYTEATRAMIIIEGEKKEIIARQNLSVSQKLEGLEPLY
ncbi:MAG: hypothetical protein Q8M95_00205 [Candidatus Methanoperedens sp.]|nr:hypothetical protein [Candidatus Methanoperedens sp.]